MSQPSPNDAGRHGRFGGALGFSGALPISHHSRTAPGRYDLVTLVSIGVALASAFVIDARVRPREQFISSPFAVPILIAANRTSPRGFGITSVVTIFFAWVATRFNQSPRGPTVFHLAGLEIISALAFLWGRQRRATARQNLEADSERMRVETILRSTVNAIVYVDAATGNVTTNPAAVSLLGRPITEEAGRAQYIEQVQTPDGHSVTWEELPSSIALRGQTSPQRELLVTRPDGSQTSVLASASPVRDPNGNVIGAVIVFQDISALKELEQLREQWTSMIAHDLRQPVTVITAYGDRLRSLLAKNGTPEERKAVEHVLSSVVSLNQMIGDLLDVSQLGSHNLALNRQPTDLASLVRVIAERSDGTLRDHPIRVMTSADAPPVDVDPGRVGQVLTNLLSNAAKYGYPSTEITVELDRRGPEVHVSVTNQGNGIPADELTRIFTPFYRTREARAGKVSGIGLGLTIAKGLVEAHGGRMWAESIPEQTTTFHFTLPIARAVSQPG